MKIKQRKEIRVSKFFMFIAGILLLKILLMILFSSEYQDELFLPFVRDYVKNGKNVYQRFYENGVTDSFPYFPVMLLLQSVGVGVIELFKESNPYVIRFLFKLPSLVIDLIGLMVLVQFYPDKRRYIAVLYYASPIILYSVFMHGQLDLIPMILLMISLLFLTSKRKRRQRYILGSLFTSLALLSKLHILAALPVICFYLYKRDGLVKTLLFLGSTLAVFLGVTSLFWSEGFSRIVLFNEQQSLLTQVSLRFASVDLYIPIAAVLFVYLLAFKVNYMNRELFLNFCGIVFSVFLVFCPPMPGWYVWIVPFMALFFASTDEEKYKNIFIYIGLNIVYLIYFSLLHITRYTDLFYLSVDMSFLKMNNPILSNGFFTILSGVLGYLILSMYQFGVSGNNFYKRKDMPFTVGIAGDSGAGKSSMISIIELGLGASNLLYIEGDGDHKWERGDRYWDEYTSLNPKANYLYRQANDLKTLRFGSAVRRIDYDHKTGKFTLPKRLRSKKYVILCGLHALYLPQARKNLDLKIYMDSDETLRRYWKIQRDTKYRGHSKEAVLDSIERRMPDARKYIYPQKRYADLIVHYFDKYLKDCTVENHVVKLSMKLSITAAVDVEPMLEALKQYDINSIYEYTDDLKRQIIVFDSGDLEEINLPVEKIASGVIPQLEELTQEEFADSINAKDGIIILFLLLLISHKMQEGS